VSRPEKDTVSFQIHGKKYRFHGNSGLLEHAVSTENAHGCESAPEGRGPDDTVSGRHPADSYGTGDLGMQPSSFNISLAATCNLSCSYCINSQGSMGAGKSKMTAETAKSVVSFLESYAKGTTHKQLTVILFGGEPFINPAAIKEIAGGLGKIGHGKDLPQFRLIIPTNGTLVNRDIIGYLKSTGLDFAINLSLDGSPGRHDANRKFRDGTASWRQVQKGIAILRECNAPFSITAVVPYPYEYKETAEELLALGFKVFEIKDLIPYAYGGNSNAEVFRSDFQLWRRKYLEYVDWYLEILEKKGEVYAVDRLNLPLFYQHYYGKPTTLACCLMANKVGIGTTGAIFPCECFIHSDFRIGSVQTGWDRKKIAGFTRVLVNDGQIKKNRAECARCYAKHSCGGGCYAQNWDRTGNLGEIMRERCQFNKERLKIDLYFLSELISIRPDLCQVETALSHDW
jgi:uncharacterized protein